VLIVLVLCPPASRQPVLEDLLLLVGLFLIGWLAVACGIVSATPDSVTSPAALLAAAMLVLAGAMGADRRAYLIAYAIGLPAVFMLLRAERSDRELVWSLLVNVAMLGVAGLLVAARRGAIDRVRERVAALAALGIVLAVLAVVAVTSALIPQWVPPGSLLVATGLLGALGAAAAAVLLLVNGVVERRAALRRAGLAFGVGTLQLALPGLTALAGGTVGIALELAAAGLFLIVAAGYLRSPGRTGTGLGPPRWVRRAAAPVHLERSMWLTSADLGPDRRTGAAELRLPEPDTGSFAQNDGSAAVRLIAADLALLYGAIGQDVRVEVHGDPWVSIDSGGLAQLLANLLANCARHAPGAEVTVRAADRGPRVRIEVIDNGPGLPPGSTARLLRRGVRGPGSTGAGLGLAICSELVERHRGSFTVVSTSGGCTAVVELPTARRGVSTEVVTA
jgi:two-component system, OmpR family, sensor kinase